MVSAPAVQAYQAFEIVGQFGAGRALAVGEGRPGAVRVAQMIHPGKLRPELELPVGHHAPDADAAETDTMVPTLAADEARAHVPRPTARW